ncbi:hypothetical protein ACFFX0_16610 [Citricoccus parietis]|uniref:Uncharacterized protein n=1 Tax=Citricoccus parietis TaxID=592307 RepID=A0ABV5G1C1_9MICC
MVPESPPPASGPTPPGRMRSSPGCPDPGQKTRFHLSRRGPVGCVLDGVGSGGEP